MINCLRKADAIGCTIDVVPPKHIKTRAEDLSSSIYRVRSRSCCIGWYARKPIMGASEPTALSIYIAFNLCVPCLNVAA